MDMFISAALMAMASGPAVVADAPELVEIVVTADRVDSFAADLVQVGTFRGAELIDVPLTVNILPRALLDAQAATSLHDALRNVAGVSRAQLNGATYDNLAVRGIIVENRSSYRLNGMLPLINLVDLPLENKDRIEVLKGVAALYYGFAPPSGIVNMVTKRADRSVTDFAMASNAGGSAGMSIDVGRQFANDIGLRINASAGIVDAGISPFSGSRIVAALAADFPLSANLKLVFDIEHVAKDVTEPTALQLLPLAQGRVPPLPDPRTNFGGENLRSDAHATNWLGRLDWRPSSRFAATLEYGEARTERDRDFSQLESYGGASGEGILRIFPARNQRYLNRNARLEFSGVLLTGPVRHTFIAGATSNRRFQNTRSAAPYTRDQNFFVPRDIIAVEPVVFTTAPILVVDRGIYATDRMSFGPVEILAGLRYSDYRNHTVNTAGLARSFSLHQWTPSVALIVKPREAFSLYATYIEGLEEGGTAPANVANALEVLAPAISRQFEAGVKAEIFQGALIQLAGFRVERSFAYTDRADNIFKLAGRARYQGIEASLTGELIPKISVYVSGQYLDAEIKRSDQPGLFGRTPENTPRWTASVFAEYRPFRNFGLGGGLFYVSGRAVDNSNSASIDGYALFTASLRYTFTKVGRTGLTVQLNGDNLANKRYWSAAGNSLLGVGLPRQVKVTVRLGL